MTNFRYKFQISEFTETNMVNNYISKLNYKG